MIAWKSLIFQSGFVAKSITERWWQDIGPKDTTISQNEILMGCTLNTNHNVMGHHSDPAGEISGLRWASVNLHWDGV